MLPLEILSRQPEIISGSYQQAVHSREDREGKKDPSAGVFLFNFSSARAGGISQPQRWLQEELEEGLHHSEGVGTLLLHQGKI